MDQRLLQMTPLLAKMQIERARAREASRVGIYRELREALCALLPLPRRSGDRCPASFL